jgi:hypothetical protein
MNWNLIESIATPRRHCVGIHPVAAIGFIGLLAFLVASCSSGTAVEEAEVRQAFGVPADMPLRDLGVVKLRAGIPTRARLGEGKDCTLTANVLTNGVVQLNVLYEFRGETIDGVKTQSHSEKSQSLYRPSSVEGWRLCLFPKGQHLAVAVQPTLIP